MLQGFDSPRRAPARPGAAEDTEAQRRSPRARTGASISSRSRKIAAPTRIANGQKIPYLQVVTNFSKPNPTVRSPPSTRVKHERNESLQERRRNGRLNGGSRSRVEALRAAEPLSGLSPSDRELLIGMSIPGPPSRPKSAAKGSLKRLQQSPKPAFLPPPPKDARTEHLSASQRGRVPSSIYSRLHTGASVAKSPPAINLTSHYSLVTSIENTSRCTSWASDFSEDDTLQHSRPESRDHNLKRDSKDSIATKHRSKGWWNQVLSPFVEEHPQLPKEIRLGRLDDEIPEENTHQRDMAVSPMTENEAEAEPDTSRRVTTSDDPNLQSFSWRWNLLKRIGMTEDSPEIFGKHGMGLAVEYFEACWHDQNRPTPYYTCENHVCSYGKGPSLWKGVDPFADGPDPDAFETSNARGLDGSLPKDDAFHQTPQNRFSKVFGAEVGGARPKSEATVFEEDLNTTPTVQEARAAPIVHASAPSEPAIKTVLQDRRDAEERVVSPAAMTPGLRTEFAERRALPMEAPKAKAAPIEARPRYPPRSDSMDRTRASPSRSPSPVPMPMPLPPSAFSPPTPNDYTRTTSMQSKTTRSGAALLAQPANHSQDFGSAGERGHVREINDSHPTTVFPPPPRKPTLMEDPKSRYMPPPREAVREAEEDHAGKEDKPKAVGFWKRIFSRRAGMTKKERKKRRCLFCCIFGGLLGLVIAIVLIVVLVTLPRSDMSVQTSWLNVSNYPPVPTGISTIVRPNVDAKNGCISPPTLWSCALPKELQESIAPNPADRPNFRIEIRFQNGTDLTKDSTFSKRNVEAGGLSLTQLVQRKFLQARDSFTNNLFAPSPAPPSEEDQEFLGNTTDQIQAPFAGEQTPFFMSFVDAGAVDAHARLRKRQTNAVPNNSTNSSNPFPDLANDIPAPSINSDGTAASANLHPFPTAQPLRLFNRGRQDEHYGFYTYFDRSIFLKSASVDNITEIGVVPDDEHGGATASEASLRCTWAQTRFLVQIWTNTQGSLPLIGANDSATSTASNAPQATNAAASSANNFTVPGSFPYPVSITLDRHGGNLDDKSVYCYGVNDREQIVKSQRKFQLENRGFGGKIVNPALGLFNTIKVSKADGGPGGIDGGSGGCSCLWRNFDFVGGGNN